LSRRPHRPASFTMSFSNRSLHHPPGLLGTDGMVRVHVVGVCLAQPLATCSTVSVQFRFCQHALIAQPLVFGFDVAFCVLVDGVARTGKLLCVCCCGSRSMCVSPFVTHPTSPWLTARMHIVVLVSFPIWFVVFVVPIGIRTFSAHNSPRLSLPDVLSA
jgi:hypothetical protein